MNALDFAALKPTDFARSAAEAKRFAAGECNRRYVALRQGRSGLTVRGTWLTDRGLAAASNGKAGE